jgi:hypothetical protein
MFGKLTDRKELELGLESDVCKNENTSTTTTHIATQVSVHKVGHLVNISTFCRQMQPDHSWPGLIQGPQRPLLSAFVSVVLWNQVWDPLRPG